VTKLFKSHKFKVLTTAPHGRSIPTHVCVHFRDHLSSDPARLENPALTPLALALDALAHIEHMYASKQSEFQLLAKWIVHDEALLQQTHDNVFSSPASSSRNSFNIVPILCYYGSDIATYFAYLKYYHDNLRIPTLVGVCLFVQEYICGTKELILLPLFGIYLALWSTVFVVFWRRKHAKMRVEWSSLGLNARDGYLHGPKYEASNEPVTISFITDFVADDDVDVRAQSQCKSASPIAQCGDSSPLSSCPSIIWRCWCSCYLGTADTCRRWRPTARCR
jgi:hypothetical protein